MKRLFYLLPVIAGLVVGGCGDAGKQAPVQEQSQQNVDQMMEKTATPGGQNASTGQPLGGTESSNVDAMYGAGGSGSGGGAPAAAGH